MTDNLLVKTKRDAQMLHWLQSATAKEPNRFPLQCLHLDKDRQMVEAVGIMNIAAVEEGYNNNIFIGHFAAGDTTLSHRLGFQILEGRTDEQGTDSDSFRIYYAIDAPELDDPGIPVEGLLFVIDNTDETRNWSYRYDPAGGEYGSLTVSISGAGGNTSEQRAFPPCCSTGRLG